MTRARALAIAASCVVLLAVWVTTAPEVQVWHAAQAPSSPRNRNLDQLQNGGGQRRPPDQSPASQTIVDDVILYILLGAVLLAFLTLLVAAFLNRLPKQRRRILKPSSEPPEADAEDMLEVPEEMLRAAQEQLSQLREGVPRNAIVACWLRLEDAASNAGTPPEPSETSVEFTTRVLSTYSVDDAAIQQLASLYREARFSVHEIHEAQREQAIDALDRLLGSFTRRTSSTTSASHS